MQTDDISSFAWLDSQTLAATILKMSSEGDNGVTQLFLLNAKGAVARRFNIPKDQYGDGADWRSKVTPIPRTLDAFCFISDNSTSSGHDATYFYVSRATGKMTRLAEGQSFSWAPDGKRFLNVSYHDTPPYDTLPNGHKRVVYTTKLQIGSVGSSKLRDLVSGLVFVDSANWRAASPR